MKNLAPVLDYVSVIRSTSIDEAARHACEFDVVYIDAGHDYTSVKADIGAWLPKVRKGGIICGDDYISGWDGVIRAVDEAFGKVERIGNQQWYVRL
jgi:predicted O-methyltransferase YrrM